MIDLRKFNLIYIQKKGGTKFLGRELPDRTYQVINTENGEIETITRGVLRGRFKPNVLANKRNKTKLYINYKFGSEFKKQRIA